MRFFIEERKKEEKKVPFTAIYEGMGILMCLCVCVIYFLTASGDGGAFSSFHTLSDAYEATEDGEAAAVFHELLGFDMVNDGKDAYGDAVSVMAGSSETPVGEGEEAIKGADGDAKSVVSLQEAVQECGAHSYSACARLRKRL